MMIKSVLLLLGAAFCSLGVSAAPSKKQTPLGVPWKGADIALSKNILDTKKVPFIEHVAGNSSWLGMNFDFQYVKPVFDAVNSTKVPLINRGESHITVITPPEFAVLATANVTIEQVNKIARDLKIQSSKVKVICLGKEDVVVSGVEKIVYQIIVSAPNLVKIREEIFKIYAKNGGNTALFDPESFWPHITVGFTSSDVFLEQGVYKGSNVCYSPLKLVKH